MAFILFVIIVLFELVTAQQYVISPSLGRDYDLKQQFGIKNYCFATIRRSGAVCTGKHSYFAGCSGLMTSGSDNNLPNSATFQVAESRTSRNKTCIDAGSDTILLPDSQVPSIDINEYRQFSLYVSGGSSSPMDNYIGVYFVNYITKLFEPVNVTFSTTGGNKVNASGVSSFFFYFRSDDNSTTGQPQDTIFDVYFEVQALHKLTVYSAGTFVEG